MARAIFAKTEQRLTIYFPHQLSVDNHSTLMRASASIEASAGTGKTFTIVRLILKALIDGFAPGFSFRNILVVTFTRKATAELKKKLRELLDDVLYNKKYRERRDGDVWIIDNVAEKRIRDAFDNFQEFGVYTIDAFCANLLMRYPEAPGVQVKSEIVKDSVLFRECVEERLRRNNDDIRALLQSYCFFPELSASYESSTGDHRHLIVKPIKSGQLVGDITDFMFRIYDKSRDDRQASAFIDDEIAALTKDELFAFFFDENHEPASVFRCLFAEELKITKDLQKARDALRQSVENYRRLTMRAPHIQIPFQTFVAESYRNLIKKIGGLYSEYGEKTSGRDNIWKRLIGCAGDDFAHKIAEVDAGDFSKEYPALLHIAKSLYMPCVDAYRKKLLFDNLTTYADIKKRVSLLLEDRRRLSRVREDYKIAFIDEFQDTDIVQCDIFFKIFGGDDHRLYLIGDPKQSIYAFRGGDVFAYSYYVKELLEIVGEDRRYMLRDNFRSSGKMIEAQNRLFESVDFGNRNEAYEIRQGNKDIRGLYRGDVEIPSLLCFKSNQNLTHEQAVGAMVEEIAELCSGQYAFDKERIVTYKDILVLCRKNSETRHFCKVLKARKIPYIFSDGTGLWKERQATEILTVLCACEDPSYMPKAWLTPFFSVDPTKLFAAEEAAENAPHKALFRKWKILVDKNEIFRLINAIIEDTKIFRREYLLADREDEIRVYERIFDLIKQTAASKQYSLKELIQWLSELIDSGSDVEDENKLYVNDAFDAVRLMTIHKSKGLEAPIVFVYYSQTSHQKNCTIHINHSPQDPRVTQMRLKVNSLSQREEDEENDRLFYVALTRAKYLTAFYRHSPTADRNASSGAILSGNLERMIDNSTLCRTVVIEKNENPVAVKSDAKSFAPPKLSELSFGKTAAEITRRYPLSPGFNSYSSVDAHRRKTIARSAFVRTEKKIDAYLSASPPGKKTGNYWHALLEKVFENKRVLERLKIDRSRYFEELLENIESYRNPEEKNDAKKVMEFALNARFETREGEKFRLIDAEYCAAEQNFFAASDVGDFYPILGAFDLLFKYRGKYCLLDWKSNIVSAYDEKSLRDHVEENYEIQYKIYIAMLCRIFKIRDEQDLNDKIGGMYYVFLRACSDKDNSGIVSFFPSFEEINHYRLFLDKEIRNAVYRQKEWLNMPYDLKFSE